MLIASAGTGAYLCCAPGPEPIHDGGLRQLSKNLKP